MISAERLLPITCQNPKKERKRVVSLHDIQNVKQRLHSTRWTECYHMMSQQPYWCSKHDKVAGMLVPQSNPFFICSDKLAWVLATRVRTLCGYTLALPLVPRKVPHLKNSEQKKAPYYMASSVSGQDESNPALWLATRADKMELSYPLGTSRCIPHENFFKSHIINSLLNRDGWIFQCEFMDLDSISVHKHAKKGQYPAILTSHLVHNPYLFNSLF